MGAAQVRPTMSGTSSASGNQWNFTDLDSSLWLFALFAGSTPNESPDGWSCEPLLGLTFDGNPARGWPVVNEAGEAVGQITVNFCERDYNQFGTTTHWGVDIGADEGTLVISTMAGEIVRSGWDGEYGMGWNVKVCDGAEWCAVYMHLSQTLVSVGANIAAGDQIGFVGATGNATGPHLHYQINHPSGMPIDPYPTLGR